MNAGIQVLVILVRLFVTNQYGVGTADHTMSIKALRLILLIDIVILTTLAD